MATINQVVIPLSKDYDDSAQSECKKQIIEKANDIHVGSPSIFDKRTLEETPEITVVTTLKIDEYGNKIYTVPIYLDKLPSELNYIKRDIIGIANCTKTNRLIRGKLVITAENHIMYTDYSYLDINSNILHHLREANYANINKYDLLILYSDFDRTNPFLRINLIYPPKPTAETE